MAEEKDIKAWKTTENGKHYPILEGETPEQAVNRTFKTGGEKAFRQNTSHNEILHKGKKSREAYQNFALNDKDSLATYDKITNGGGYSIELLNVRSCEKNG